MDISQPHSALQSILIVDDDADLLILLRIKLQGEGFRVFTANNAAGSHAILEMQNIDVVLMDILIDTESGAELCYQLKHDPQTAHLPVLLFSGHHNLAQLTAEAGADGFIPKPVDIAQLKKIVAQIVKQPG
jgi:CheY-like chemotaxis protein